MHLAEEFNSMLAVEYFWWHLYANWYVRNDETHFRNARLNDRDNTFPRFAVRTPGRPINCGLRRIEHVSVDAQEGRELCRTLLLHSITHSQI